MTYILATQNSYTHVEIGLIRDGHIVDEISCDKRYASAQFLILLGTLLERNGVLLNDISCIGVNQGPGPFTTLRVVLSSVNGLSFASHIPLIGIDGIHAAMHEYIQDRSLAYVYLLDAFSKDVYYGIWHNDQLKTGYEQGSHLLLTLSREMKDKKVCFFGGGAQLYRDEIASLFTHNAHLDESFVMPSLACLGLLAHEAFLRGTPGVQQLLPLYLKKRIQM